MNSETIRIAEYKSPVGMLVVGSHGGRLCLCDWQSSRRHEMVMRRLQRHLATTIEHGSSDIIEAAIKQLDEYFSSLRRKFSVPLALVGTDFQRSVWQELRQIPFGSATSYADIARRTGKPKAVRAVATAIASNALSIFIPCHRIVGSGGNLTGYAGGMEAKQYLLDMEIFSSF